MIQYKYPEEKQVALIFADKLESESVKTISERGEVTSRDEAILLSKFFWDMVNLSANETVKLPVEGGSEYWTKKLYNSFGGYIYRVGFGFGAGIRELIMRKFA
jgi:hypothetical protein